MDQAQQAQRRRPAYLSPTNTVVKTLSRLGVSTGVIKVLTVAGRTSGLKGASSGFGL